MVRGAIIRRQTGAVHTETHGQFLQSGIVVNHIHRTLHKGRIHAHIGFEALGGLAAGKQGRVLLCNSYIKESLGEEISFAPLYKTKLLLYH
jgi:hypothetical protein